MSTGRPAAGRGDRSSAYVRGMTLPPRAEVVVVGAGLAGLSAATRLAAAGRDVHLVDAADHVGGRLTTTRVDGFTVDRGFQVLNTGYPRVADLDLPALDMGWFWTGAVVQGDDGPHRVVDPRQHPGTLLDTVRAPIGSLPRKAALGAFSARAGYLPVRRLLTARERTAEEALRAAGVGEQALETFLRPFLSGVLLEDRLTTSSRYLDLVWRSFVRGRVGLPAAGMQSVGQPGQVHLGVRVTAVDGGSVRTATGTTLADAVVVATDPDTAGGLLPGLGASAPRQVTTHLHVLPASPWSAPLIVLGRPDGRLVNSVVVSDAQPAYSPDGRALVASSTLQPTREADLRTEIARAHGVATGDLEHLTSVTVTGAQPAATVPLQHRQAVDLGEGLFVCGDHRDTPSIQGAMASGARTARAVLRRLTEGGRAPVPHAG
jgi:phytoene dehydrogenase-like protein